MAISHEVRLSVGAEGLRITSWDEVAITHDMLSPGSPWSVTLWRPSEGAGWDRVLGVARLFAPVVLEIDQVLQLRGQIERRRAGGDRSGAPLTLAGRDLAGAALSSHLDPRASLRGVTLAEALTRMFEPLGIPLTVGLLASEAREIQAGSRPRAGSARTRNLHHRVDRYRFPPGTTVMQAADTLCRRHGYLLYTAPTASGLGLVIDRPEYDAPVAQSLVRRRTPDGTFEGNLLSGFRDLNGSDVPSSVTVYGHSTLTAREDARHRAETPNTALLSHPLVLAEGARRPHYLQDRRARTPQAATQRARRETARAMAGFDVYEATVQGFRSNGRLWAVNSMVHVDDELADVHSDWLVTRVTFHRSRSGGHVAALRLVPKGALVIEPDPEV